MENRRRYILIIVLTVAVIGLGCSGRQGEPASLPVTPPGAFIIAGSGSSLPIAMKLAEGYFRETGVRITIPGSIGSDGGIQAVTDGVIDLGLSSRQLCEQEINAGLRQIPYARVVLIIGVNRDVPDTGITYQDLVDIFRGKKTQWSNRRTIVVLSRQAGESTLHVMEAAVPGFKQALEDSFKNRRWQVCYTAAEETKAIIRTGSSIGFTDTGALTAGKLQIKALKVNGVEPTLENIKNGRYKLYIDLYFIYKEPLSERARKFLEFVLSGDGQEIISANGGIPWKGK